MTSAKIKAGGREYMLTDEHSSSNYGQPILIDQDGAVFGPWENVIDNPNAKMSGGETYRSQVTARAIAAYARDDHPNDADVLDLVKRFEAVQETPKRGRPPVPPDARKDARVELRVHPDAKAAWQAKADAAGLSLNAWAEAALNAAKK
jgi:hypothetical protein